MNLSEASANNEVQAGGAVFISYATADRKRALDITKDLERRGTACWISTRNVAPGENYQEAIVRALRAAPAMVLIFSAAANNSDEIKKELSLASRYRIPVIALRVENVEPSDAFAYELSTRQWIDAFAGSDKPIDELIGAIGQRAGQRPSPASAARQPTAPFWRGRGGTAVVATLLILLGAGAWLVFRPGATPTHSMSVRLTGYKPLSADLPPNMRDTVDAEISAAFNADGVVGVSTASAPAPGTGPAYALGGTIQRDGNMVRVITRLVNERSGETLWSDNADYDGKDVGAIPRHIAVDAGNVVRCGLFGASTYRKPLPDAVLRDYLLFCKGHWNPAMTEGRKALLPAQRVVAAVPDFSWGWAAVAGGYWKIAMNAESPALADQARASGRDAADRGIALDSNNTEALYIKSMLVPRRDWIAREDLLKRAVESRRLDCGCEHHQYGWMLLNVGRVTEAVDQLRQANDMLALYVYTPETLAEGLVSAGKTDEARQYFKASAALAPDAEFAASTAAYSASQTGDIKALENPKLPIPAERRAALLTGYRAFETRNAAAGATAIRMLLALPEDQQDESVALLLAKLGATREAFVIARRVATSHEYPGPSLLFYQGMRGTLNDPGVPALLQQLGLLNYWKATHTRPDVCKEQASPAFCRMI